MRNYDAYLQAGLRVIFGVVASLIDTIFCESLYAFQNISYFLEIMCPENSDKFLL